MMSRVWAVFEHGIPRRPQFFAAAGVALVACLIGAALPVYVAAVGDSPARLAALPALLLLASLLVFSRKVLLLLIILFRASADLLLESTKLSVGGYQIGVGALINAFVLFIALLLVVEKPGCVPKKMVAAMWAGFLFTALLGVAIAPLKVDAIRTFLALISYLAVFVSAFYFVRSTRDFRFCVRIVLWSSVPPVLYAIVDIALNSQGTVNGFRLQSTFTHPNIFAFYLTLVISLALYVLKSNSFAPSIGKRSGLIAYMLFLLSLLILTQTRSAWTACFAVFAVYGILFERRYVAYLMVAALLAFLIPGVRDRLIDLGTGNEYVKYAKLNSFAWRRLIWESGLKWMQPGHYFLGYGLDSFKYYAPVFSPLAGGLNFGAHSVYVQWLFEAGVAGLLAFLWLFGRLLWLLRRMAAIDKLGAFVSIALIIEYLTIAFSDNMFSYLAFNWYFWFMLGAACAVVVAADSEPPSGAGAAGGFRVRPDVGGHPV